MVGQSENETEGFLVDNVAVWFLAPELAKRIEWVAQHEDKAYLPRGNKPQDKLYACSEYGGFYLSLTGWRLLLALEVFELPVYPLTKPEKNGFPMAKGIIFNANLPGRGFTFSLWVDRQPVSPGNPITTKTKAILGFFRITLTLVHSKLSAKLRVCR